MIYYLLFWLLALASFCEVFIKRGKKIRIVNKVFVFVIVVTLILFAGLREDIGIDIGSYNYNYFLVETGELPIFNIMMEPGFTFLNYIAPSFRWLLIITATATILVRLHAFKRNKLAYVILPIFVYYGSDYLFYDMGIMRQGLSMSICLLSLPFLEHREKVFFVYVAFAALFHISAVLFCLMWFVSNREYSRKFYYYWLLIGILFFMAGTSYTELASQIVNLFGGEYVGHKFYKYMDYDQVEVTLSFVRRIVFLIIFVEIYKRKSFCICNRVIPKRKITNATWLYINGFFVSVMLFALFSPLFSAVAGRLTAVFYTMYAFVYCDMFSDKRQILNIVWFILFSLLLFATFNSNVNNINGNYLPYRWDW